MCCVREMIRNMPKGRFEARKITRTPPRQDISSSMRIDEGRLGKLEYKHGTNICK